MIKTYLETHDIPQSCRNTRVTINTFRRWYPRYFESGLEGIKKPKYHTNKHLERIEEKDEKLVFKGGRFLRPLLFKSIF